ncbi:uncharacterized protein LOC111048449 [Nilaparvata lugens]|uniref:uncharacterized protein LOC111048449 n=1 Tax=Nilaparvata lugens TaxID=108931 RepID=UPI00193DEF72|nr:uncharacterized protein LOC111048449 [Nilaparvata lugens]
MTRKGKKFNSNAKNDKAVLLERSSGCLKCSKSVFLNENFDRWYRIRSECSFSNDEDFTSYLLDIVESKTKSNNIGNNASKDSISISIDARPLINASALESKSIVSQNTKKNNLRILKVPSPSSEQLSGTRPKAEESPAEKGDEGERSDGISDEEKENVGLDEDTKAGSPAVVKDDIGINSRLEGNSYDPQCKQIVISNCASSTENSIILKETEQNQDLNKVKKHQHNKNSNKITNVLPEKQLVISKNSKKDRFSSLEKGRKEETASDERPTITGRVDWRSNIDSGVPHRDALLPADGVDLKTEPSVDDDPTPLAMTIKVCGDCDSRHAQNSCPLRSPQSVVEDALSWEQYSGESDTSEARESDSCETRDVSFAHASLPSCLETRVTDSEHGLGVVTRQPVPAFTRFGPLVGRPIKQMEIPDDCSMKHVWEMLSDEAGTCAYVNTEGGNWVRWLRPAPSRDTRNLVAMQMADKLYFVTTTPLAAGQELLYWTSTQHHAAWVAKKITKTNCGGCNLQFAHTIYYHRHCSVFHDPNFSLTIRKYHCKICGLSVLGKENIMKHAANNHDGKGAYQCQFCKKFFLRLNYLEMHRTYGCSLNPHRTRPLCDYCGRKFCQPQKLKIHIKRMHSEISEVLKEFQCKRCLKILGSRAALQRHTKEVHHKAMLCSCTCDKCGKLFQNKSNLKIHMLTHSGIKPFKCQQNGCLAAFTTKQCLQLHYKKVHGYADNKMPTIERSVAYTFDAYAGERQDDQGDLDVTANASTDANSCCSSPAIDDGDMDDQQIEIEQVDDYRQYSSPHSVEEQEEELAGYDERLDPCDQERDEWVEEGVRVVSPDNTSQQPRDADPGFYRFAGDAKPESSNASLLVEAALDAAEKDIEMSFRGNKLSPDPLFPMLHGNVERMDAHRDVSKDYSMCHPGDQYGCASPAAVRAHPVSGYMLPERLQPHFELHLSPIDAYPEARGYDSQPRRPDESYSSSDDNDNAVQNLSVGLKHKSLQLDLHTGYKYDAQEERSDSFECEGVDMSRAGIYHHGFVSRYPHYSYAAHSADVLRVVNLSHSIDLSLASRGANHHHMMDAGLRGVSTPPPPPPPPPPPAYQNYPSPPPAAPYLATGSARVTHSPNISMYHHFSSY